MRFKGLPLLSVMLIVVSAGWVQDSSTKADAALKAKQEAMKRELNDLRAKRGELDKRIMELERQLGLQPERQAEQTLKEAQEALKRALEALKQSEGSLRFWEELPEGQTFKFHLPDGKGEMRSFYFGPEGLEKLQEKLKNLYERHSLPFLKDIPLLDNLPQGEWHTLPDKKGWYYFYQTPNDKQLYLFGTPEGRKFSVPFGSDPEWCERLQQLQKLLQDQPAQQDEQAWKDWLKRLQELIESWKKV